MGAGALDVVAPSARRPTASCRRRRARSRQAAHARQGARRSSVAAAARAARHARRAGRDRRLDRRPAGAVRASCRRCPRELSPAIVIVQHVDSEFSAGLASWLQEATPRSAVSSPPPASRRAPGSVLLAATEDHLVMTAAGTLAYTDEPRALPYRPSVDVLFHSLAEHWRGAGDRGAAHRHGPRRRAGLKSLRDAGWHTIAQDEASSRRLRHAEGGDRARRRRARALPRLDGRRYRQRLRVQPRRLGLCYELGSESRST